MSGKMNIQNAEPKDLDGIMKVEIAEYSPIDWVVPRDVMEFRMLNCYYKRPFDLFWVAKRNNDVLGYITGLIINFDSNNPPNTREEAIGYALFDGELYGFGKNHDPKSNALYVMSIGVLEKGKGIASSLIKTTTDFVKNNNLKFRVAGLRSGYAEYKKQHPEITPEQYINLRRSDGQFLDGLMRLYARHGFEELGIKKIYAPEDIHGEGWGNIMVWRNPMD